MKGILLKILVIAMAICSALCVFTACGGVEFKINFVVDGEIYATVNTNGGETIKMPDDPEKTDYTFDGWFWDKDVWEKPFTANSLLDAPLSSDMSVYAKWKEDEKPNKNALLISATGFILDGNNGKISVSNDTETYSFINQIQVSAGASWVISTDIYGMQTIVTKTIPLNIGDNTVYMLITSGDGENINLYTMVVRRRPIYTVSFNTNGGTTVDNQQAEEDSFATEPTTTRIGYTFDGWDYDFTKPIINDTEIAASWTANTDTPYKVEYYLENLDDNNYTIDYSDSLTGTTDTIATVNKTYEHFTVIENTASANINAAGDTVLKVYYKRNRYSYSVSYYYGGVSCSAAKYGTIIKLNVLERVGYDFIGWFNGETEISKELKSSTILIEDCEITAKFVAHTNTPYKIEYYLENLDDDNYTLQENDTENLTGTTGSIITATKTYEHFTVLENTAVGCISGDGNTVLKVYYNLDRYTVKISAENNCAKLNHEYDGSYKYGLIIPTITATYNNYLGCEWHGWYVNDEFMTEDFTIPSFTVDNDIQYCAKGVKSEMSNFNFTSNNTYCQITGIKNKMVTEIVVPDYVTHIVGGAFSGCSELISITIPFVGQSYGVTDSSALTWKYPFGFIFGTTSYKGGTETSQSYYNPNEHSRISTVYYIPSSLKSVTITNGNKGTILSRAFQNCSGLTSIIIGDSVRRIGSYAFYNCSGLTSICIPSCLDYIEGGAFINCNNLNDLTFISPNTWHVKRYESDSGSGTVIDLTDSAKNATYFTSTLGTYYWYRT